MTHATCRLTAKNRDQLRNPTRSSQVWAAFTFYIVVELQTVTTFTDDDTSVVIAYVLDASSGR